MEEKEEERWGRLVGKMVKDMVVVMRVLWQVGSFDFVVWVVVTRRKGSLVFLGRRA